MARWPSQRLTRRSSLLIGLSLVALGAASLIVGVWSLFGQRIDNWLFTFVLNTIPGPLRRGLDLAGRSAAPIVLAPVASVLAVVALTRRRWADLATSLLITPLVPLAQWLREDVVTRPELGVGTQTGNSFPSTHAAAGFVVIAAILVLWPRPVDRPVVIGAIVLSLIVGLGNVAWYAHRPVDVLGSACLVGGCTLVLLALLSRRRWARRHRVSADVVREASPEG